MRTTREGGFASRDKCSLNWSERLRVCDRCPQPIVSGSNVQNSGRLVPCRRQPRISEPSDPAERSRRWTSPPPEETVLPLEK